MVEFLSNHLAVVWLLIGISCIILEASIIPGIGFFFAGLAALTLGGLITFNVLPPLNIFTQSGYFFLLTFLWGVLLWKPFKSYLRRLPKKGYSTIIGEKVTVVSTTIGKNEKGQISWSGTTMSALLDPQAMVTSVPKGMVVYIVGLSGTTAIVAPLPRS